LIVSLSQAETLARLETWLNSHVSGWSNVKVKPLDVKLGAGFSADIFFVDAFYDFGGARRQQTLVVRRQPQSFEVVLGSSLSLQGNIMAALSGRGDIPVPPWIGMELDPSILGMPFLIMGKVEGQAAPMHPNYNVAGFIYDMTPEARFKTWKNGIEAFAELTKIDWRDGFEFLARPEWGVPGLDQYVGHIAAWHKGAGKGRSLNYVDAALDYVLKNKPANTSVNVLWGDPTASNVLFAPDGGVNALIDWELAALGPSELDLAWWLYFDDLFSTRFGVKRLDGLPARQETIAIWEAATGKKAANLDYYDVVVGLRMALVVVGSFDREVARGRVKPDNASLNANFMTLYLAGKLGMTPPELGDDFHEFMGLMAGAGKT
jgi:aminoglycoside phosphotransferase (APT) family kinase protein